MTATDSGSPPRHTNLTLFISIESTTDDVPHFAVPNYNFSIPENRPSNGSSF